jgi:hypothetical protein
MYVQSDKVKKKLKGIGLAKFINRRVQSDLNGTGWPEYVVLQPTVVVQT